MPDMKGSGYVQIFVSVPDAKTAGTLAESLVGKKLVGCFQVIGPVKSTYRWQGKIERSKEHLCLMKTRRGLYARVEKEIGRLHPYTVPEILAVPVAAGSRDYLRWLDQATGL